MDFGYRAAEGTEGGSRAAAVAMVVTAVQGVREAVAAMAEPVDLQGLCRLSIFPRLAFQQMVKMVVMVMGDGVGPAVIR